MRLLTLGIGDAFSAPDGWTRTGAVPFSSARKWSAATFDGHGTWVIGAPEMILLDSGTPARRRADELAAEGRRVLLLVRSDGALDGESLPPSIDPAALVLLEERVRPDAADTLRCGTTTVRDVGCPHGVVFALREAVEQGIVPGPRILASGAPLVMTGGHCHPMGVEIDGPYEARKAARQYMQTYVPALPNYTNNLRDLGYGDADFADGCSDRLVDDIVAWGSEQKIVDRFKAHLDAGASHVCFLPLRPDGIPMADDRALDAFAPSRLDL